MSRARSRTDFFICHSVTRVSGRNRRQVGLSTCPPVDNVLRDWGSEEGFAIWRPGSPFMSTVVWDTLY